VVFQDLCGCCHNYPFERKGGCENQCKNEEGREPYASVMTCIRTDLRFALLKSTLAAIQGF